MGAFTCYDLEAAGAVLDMASARGEGVILLIGGKVFAEPSGPLLLAALCAVADRSPARACVQLDHCSDLEVIDAALSQGAGAVMADGSALPDEENTQFVRRAAELARRSGAAVECELGGITGDEDVAVAVAAGALTDPAQAARFMQATGADCLAVSIGNVHGTYRDPPAFDWSRLAAIGELVEAPLSLHGASGVPDAMLQQALEAGIAKVNFNTELRQAYIAATADTLAAATRGAQLNLLHAEQARAVAGVVGQKMDVLGGKVAA